MGLTVTRDELIEKHLGIVYNMAWEMKRGMPKVVDVEDLIGDGMLGLLVAAERFDPSRDLEFHTYARWRVRGHMLDGLRQRDVVSRRKNWDPDDQRLQPAIRLDAPSRLTEDAGPIGESIPDSSPDFAEVLANDELSGWALQFLDQKLRDIIFAIYWDERPMHEIGLELGVTESRVSQMHAQALHQMRLALLDSGLGTSGMNEEVRTRVRTQRREKLTRSERNAMFADLLSLWTD